MKEQTKTAVSLDLITLEESKIYIYEACTFKIDNL